MKTSLELMFSALILLSTTAASPQSVTGSTTVSLDPETGMITAVCETDLDADAQTYYGAHVTCALQDGDGNLLASGLAEDNEGFYGYAQVVLTYQGVPGNIYFATGSHLAYLILGSDPVEGQPQQFFDYYNLAAFNDTFLEGYAFFPNTYNFFGPGPQQERRSNTIQGGKTVDQVAYPLPSVQIYPRFQGPITSTDGLNTLYKGIVGTIQLGLVQGEFGPNNGCVVGDEVAGVVTPSNSPGPITVKRFITAGACYRGQRQIPCTGEPVPGDDTGTLLEDDPQNMTINGSAGGQVFNVDVPGIYYENVDSSVVRVRYNFISYAVAADGKTVISDFVPYFVRLSCTNGSGVASFVLDANINDNDYGGGSTAVTWNLH